MTAFIRSHGLSANTLEIFSTFDGEFHGEKICRKMDDELANNAWKTQFKELLRVTDPAYGELVSVSETIDSSMPPIVLPIIELTDPMVFLAITYGVEPKSVRSGDE